MSQGKMILVGGGVRSGKSSFALKRANAFGKRRTFVATAQPFDDEMRRRIVRHQAERKDAFFTVEAPLELLATIQAFLPSSDVVVVDCLTLWISNLLLDGQDEANILAQAQALVAWLQGQAVPVILVSNEVGMGVVPERALGREFRDVMGKVHQMLAPGAQELYLAALGTILRLRPDPIQLLPMDLEEGYVWPL